MASRGPARTCGAALRVWLCSITAARRRSRACERAVTALPWPTGKFCEGNFCDGATFLTGIRRTASTIIAYDVSLDEYSRQTRVLDASTGDRVLLSSGQIGGTSAARVLLKRDGMLATTIGTYSGSGNPNPDNVEVVICDVADCSPPSNHVVAHGADIDPSSLRREAEQACWTRNVAMRTPQKECAPLSID